MKHFPIVLFGSDYWGGLLKWMRETMEQREHCIGPHDLDLLQLTDDTEEAARFVLQGIEEMKQRQQKIAASHGLEASQFSPGRVPPKW